MILSSTLLALKTYIEESGILTYSEREPYQIQLTPDERPFAYSGENIITLFGNELIRNEPTKDQRSFDLNFTLCVTRRVTSTPRDRQYNDLYLDSFISLSQMSELLTYTIDSNNILNSTVRTAIEGTRDTLSTALMNLGEGSSGSDGLTDSIADNLDGADIIGTFKVLTIQARPIPRDDDFFTAYSTKRSRNYPLDNERIVVSGYSMLITVKGPTIILPPFCV